MRSGEQEPRRPLATRGVTDPDEGTRAVVNSQRVGCPRPWPELPVAGTRCGLSPNLPVVSEHAAIRSPGSRAAALESRSCGPGTVVTQAAAQGRPVGSW